MKKIFFLITFCAAMMIAKADDVTAVVTNATIGFNNGSIVLNLSAGTAPYTFSWTGPGGFVSSDQNISGLTAGEYCVTVTDFYCGMATLCVTVEESQPTAIAGNSIGEWSVAPNPFSDAINITLSIATGGDYTLILSDATGRNIASKQLNLTQGTNNIYFNTPAGIAGGNFQVSLINSQGQKQSEQLIHLR